MSRTSDLKKAPPTGFRRDLGLCDARLLLDAGWVWRIVLGWSLAAVAASVMIGCGPNIVGRYEGKVDFPSETGRRPPDWARSLLASASMRLELKEDGTAEMVLLGVPVQGTYVRKGDRLTIAAERVFGYGTGKAGPASESDGRSAAVDATFAFRISADGQSLTLVRAEGLETKVSAVGGEVVFWREKP